MKHSDPEFELKILRDVLEQVGDPEVTLGKQVRFRKWLLMLGSAALTAAFVLAFGSSMYAVLIAAVAGAGGVAMGFGVYLKFTQDQWPITVRHIHVEGIRSRIEQLQAR